MENKNYNRPLLPLTIATMVGIFTGMKLPGFLYTAGCFALTFLTIAVVSAMKGKLLKYVPVLLFISIAYLLIQPFVDVVFTTNHIKSYAGTTKYRITGVVESRPVQKKRRYVFILKTETITGEDDICRPASGKLRVSLYGDRLLVKKGDTISLRSKIRLFRNFNNPGGFDYEQFMAFQDVWGSAYTNEKKVDIIRPALFSPVVAAQDSVIKLIDNNIRKDDTRGVLKALIVGDKQWIRPTLRDSFNRTGTGHLLAISGLHIGIVAACAFWCFCYVLSFSHYMLWNGKIFKYAGLMALIPVMVYGFIAGMSPSTQRAVIMVTVMLLTHSCRTEYDIINALALAALLILAASPASLFSISFQLSFTAVFAIACGISMLENTDTTDDNTEPSKKTGQVIKKKLFSYLLISFFAFAGTLPVVIYYFNQISTVGLAANFILVPLVGFIVVPVGLLAALIYPLSSIAGDILIKISGYALEKALSLIRILSEFTFASVKTITPSIVEMICYYCLFYLVLRFFYDKANGIDRNSFRMKIVFGVIVLVFMADIFFGIDKRFFHNSFRVTAIDVGQGSSTLLEFPDGKCMLIDGGGFNDNAAFDVGERIIAPFLWRKKIRTVDTVVLTHPESDHLNGLLYILKHFNVKDVWSNGQKRFLKGYQEFEYIIQTKKIGHTPFKDLQRHSAPGGVAMEIMYPPDDFIEKQRLDRWRNTNNNSLVLRAEYQSVSFLFPGDIMAKAEAELVRTTGDALRSTVLFAPHHGSKTSDTAAFLRKVQPQYAVISAGWKNRFNIPHDSVLKRLNDAGAKVYRTDTNGATVMVVRGNSLTLDSQIK